MADFGLAAQIGRGNAMPGAQQQQDPQNRMMQMMQLQQLQQNMMLAREQENRAAGLYGLQRGTLEETLNNLREAEKRAAGTHVPELARKETDLETAKLQQRMQLVQTNLAEGAFNVKTRLLKLRSSTEPEVMLSPNFRKSLMGTDPELAVEIDRLASEGEKTGAEIQKAGYDRDTAKLAVQKAVVSSIADNLGGVVDQQTFSTVLKELEKVDPLAPKLIGTRFDDVSLRKLGMRLRGLKNYELRQKPSGEWERIDINAAESSVITPAAPAASQLGNLDAAQASNPSSPQLIGAGAAGLASTPGGAETPIIGQRAPTPEGLGPTAVAKGQDVTATKSAESTFDAETRKRNAREVLNVTSTPEIDKLISRSTSGGLQRGIAGAYEFVTGQSTKGQEAIGQLETVANKLAFDMAGGKLGAGFSNEDRAFLLKLLGDVGNPDIGANRRVAAFRQFREGLKAIESGKPLSVVPGSATPASIAPEVQSILDKYPPQTRAGS